MSDLIKKEDAIRAVWECYKMVAERDIPQNVVDLAMVDALQTTLSAIPSADRPQGEWIDAEMPLESGDTMPIQVCNLCKTFYPLAYTGGGHRFCPNCGARMKGADDE